MSLLLETITHLSLVNNKIGPSGVEGLAETLANNTVTNFYQMNCVYYSDGIHSDHSTVRSLEQSSNRSRFNALGCSSEEESGFLN